MVVRVARRYQQHGLNFCIITFYDPQRAAITKALENEGLPSDRVYNVDSFQGMCHSLYWFCSPRQGSLIPNRRWTGNEADYVILSSVRTHHPGFLKSQPRMNVALTRCRKGMVVVTDKRFLERVGRSMLLGKLCSTWSQRYEACWIDWKAMLNNSVALPGLPLPLPPPIPVHGMLVPELAVQRLALYRSQQVQALARIDEQSRPNPIHSVSQRTAALPRDPSSSKPKTWGQLSQALRSTSALGSASTMESERLTTVAAAERVRPTVGQTERRGGPGGTPTAAAVAAASGEVDNKFPSLRQLAAVLGQPSSSRRRKSKR